MRHFPPFILALFVGTVACAQSGEGALTYETAQETESQNESGLNEYTGLNDTELRRKTPPWLVNGAFGLGKNFHAWRAAVSYSPLDMPEGWEKWDFYMELGFYSLHRHIYKPKNLYITTLTPFVRYHFCDAETYFDPHWDIGIGGAYRDKRTFGTIPISTNSSFHIITSFGFFPFGTQGPALSLKWIHFSNAKVKIPNNGIDIHVNVGLEYAF